MKIPLLKKKLNWYFNYSASILGLKSNYFSLINTSYGSTPFMENEAIIHNLSKIREHRLIHQALLSLPPKEYRQFSALYFEEYQYRYPPIIRLLFKEKTGLALTLSYNLEQLLDLCQKHRHQALSPLEQQTLNSLILLTNATYLRLHKHLQYNQYIQQLSTSHSRSLH